jgi:hypothetical protein
MDHPFNLRRTLADDLKFLSRSLHKSNFGSEKRKESGRGERKNKIKRKKK